MVDYYWIGSKNSNSSDPANWSLSSGGSVISAWVGTSPDANDNFHFDDQSTVTCDWEQSVTTMGTIKSIQCSLDSPFTGVIRPTINITMQGLILNCELRTVGAGTPVLSFAGTPLTALQDSTGRERYILNGQFANIDNFVNGTYKITNNAAGNFLDNGPYPQISLNAYSMDLRYNEPTATTHDHADDGTIHIKGSVTIAATSGFVNQDVLNMKEDTKVKIKFDTTSLTITSTSLDFAMATAFFRGSEIPVTGSTTYGNVADGFTAKHYSIVVFASTPGETCTVKNGLSLDCYSLEVKAGAVFRAQQQSYNTSQPAKIESQTEPVVAGVWAFSSSANHTFTSPKSQYITNIPSGGTGRTNVSPNALLIGNASSAHQPLNEVQIGTNGQVLTVVSGAPAWATGGGGGGGMTSFTLAGDSGSNQTIEDGNTLTVAGGTGLSSVGSATDTVTINLDNTAVTAGSYTNADITVDAQGRLTSAANGSAYTDADAISAVEGTSSLDLTGDLTLDTAKKIVMDEKTYASASPSSGTIELTAEKTGSNSPLLTLRTPSGYLRIGPQNASFCHFYTDRSYFYFNKPIQMDGGSFYAYNDDLLIKTDDSGSGQPTRIFIDAGVDPCRVGIGNGFTSSNLPATELEVAGTIRQSNATSAVLVADSNGDLVAATNLADAVYVQSGQGGNEPFTIAPPGAPTDWAGAPPATIDEAINRIASAFATAAPPGPIP